MILMPALRQKQYRANKKTFTIYREMATTKFNTM